MNLSEVVKREVELYHLFLENDGNKDSFLVAIGVRERTITEGGVSVEENRKIYVLSVFF